MIADRLERYKGGDKVSVICYALMSFLTGLALAHSDTTLYPLWLRRLYLYFILVCLFVAVFSSVSKHAKLTVGIAAPFIYFSLTTFHTNLGLSSAGVFDAFYSGLRLIAFFFLTYKGQERVFELFRRFLIIVSVLGIIVFFAHVLSIPLPHRNVEYYTDSIHASYIDYYFGILFSELGAVRLCGLFNEPGAFGTFLALTLCAEKYDFKKKGNLILFIAGCCAFSVAFFIITAVHFILRTYQNKKVMIPLLLVVLFILFVLPQMQFENPIIQMFVSRFVFEDGMFTGDNRSSDFIDQTVSEVLSGSNSLWGMGKGYLSFINYESGASTYKTMLIDYGILGFLLIYGSLFVTALKQCRKNPWAINLLICFMLSVYQRPNVYTLVYFVILFGGIQHAITKTSCQQPIK